MNTRIIFLPVPETFYALFGSNEDGFRFNPKIPIPVEIPAGNEKASLENMTKEMILTAMLHVIEEGVVEQEWIDYYCRFIVYLRPDIIPVLKELKGGKNV